MVRKRKIQKEKLLPLLKEIYNREITLKKSNNKEILNVIIKGFKDISISNSPLFSCLFNRIYCTGSSYEGLRVRESTEFDLNVVLQLPPEIGCCIKIVEVDNPASFSTLQLCEEIGVLLNKCSNAAKLNQLTTLFDHQNFLIGKKVLQWFQSLVDHFETAELPPQISSIKKTNSGPARTLKVYLKDGSFSVDLVPVFEINGQKYLKEVEQWTQFLSPNDFKECYMVPKPLVNFYQYNLSPEKSSRLWRIHLPGAEKKMLFQRCAMKPVIKLVKDLNEKERWHIPSYFIKTIGFWIAAENPERQYWEEQEMGARYLEILEFLRQTTESAELSHFFYPNYNLLECKNKIFLRNTSNRLKKILMEMNKNPNNICKYYLPHRYKEI